MGRKQPRRRKTVVVTLVLCAIAGAATEEGRIALSLIWQLVSR